MTKDLCPYMNKCKQKKRQICIDSYINCTIYQRMKVLGEGFIGSTTENPSKRDLEMLVDNDK